MTNNQWIYDCHSHFSFYPDHLWDQFLSSGPQSCRRICGGYDPRDWQVQLELQQRYPGRFYNAFGLHPWYVCSEQFDLTADTGLWQKYLPQADFVGELGLDFSKKMPPSMRQRQIQLFEFQLKESGGRPLVLHIVGVHAMALEMIQSYEGKGFVHSFAGSIEVAKRWMKKGFLLSIGPQVCRPQSHKLRATVALIPMDYLLIESDRPSHGTDLDDSRHTLDSVAAEVARIKGVTVKELQHQVKHNIEKLLPHKT
jgi:TatD DNase family protein